MAVILFHTNLGESPMPSPHVTQLRTSMMWTWPLAEDQLKAVRPCISLACWDGSNRKIPRKLMETTWEDCGAWIFLAAKAS